MATRQGRQGRALQDPYGAGNGPAWHMHARPGEEREAAVRYAKSIGSEGRIVAGHPHRVGRYRHAMGQVRMQPELGRCQRHATGESMPGRNAPGLPARLASAITLEASSVLRHAQAQGRRLLRRPHYRPTRLGTRYTAAAAASRVRPAAPWIRGPARTRAAAAAASRARPAPARRVAVPCAPSWRPKRLRRLAHCAQLSASRTAPILDRNGCGALRTAFRPAAAAAVRHAFDACVRPQWLRRCHGCGGSACWPLRFDPSAWLARSTLTDRAAAPVGLYGSIHPLQWHGHHYEHAGDPPHPPGRIDPLQVSLGFGSAQRDVDPPTRPDAGRNAGPSGSPP